MSYITDSPITIIERHIAGLRYVENVDASFRRLEFFIERLTADGFLSDEQAEEFLTAANEERSSVEHFRDVRDNGALDL